MHQKKFVRILLFFYFFSTFVSATHIHHHAPQSHVDCKVCIVVKNLHSADVPSAYIFESLLPYYLTTLAPQNKCYASQTIKGYNAQAPPTFS